MERGRRRRLPALWDSRDVAFLAALLKKIAGDEGRHAQGFAHYARKLARADPERAVPVLLRVGQLWCDPDGGLTDANPAAENYQDPETAAAMAELHYRWVDPDRERRAICSLFGDIAGLPISSPDDFVALRKKVQDDRL